MTRREFLSGVVIEKVEWQTDLRLSYDPSLIEDVVMAKIDAEAQQSNFQLYNRYHKLADQLYEESLPEERDAAFMALHRRLFFELGYERLLQDALAEFPAVKQSVVEVTVTKALHRHEEGADLRERVDDGRIREKVLVLTLRPQRFLEAEGGDGDSPLRRFLRHELQHISDMLDPNFGYERTGRLAETPTQENIVRDRYRLLWDITVDGRLTRQGKGTVATKEQRQMEFERMFAKLPEGERLNLFERLWSSDSPKHFELLSLAKEPARFTDSPILGSPCPLCRFPTYAWANGLDADTVARIQLEFPQWQPQHGICERCAELYQVTAGGAATR